MSWRALWSWRTSAAVNGWADHRGEMAPSCRRTVLSVSALTGSPGREPVFGFQPCDAIEFLGTVRNEYGIERLGVGGDHQVVGTEQSAAFFEVSPDGAVQPSGGGIEGEDSKTGQEAIEYPSVVLPPHALRDSVFDFGDHDRREKDRVGGNVLQPICKPEPLLAHSDQDVCIKEKLHVIDPDRHHRAAVR